MDPLTDILRDLRPRSTVLSTVQLREPWGLVKECVDAIPFHILAEGRCLLIRSGERRPIELAAGDLVMLARGERHVLASHREAQTVSFSKLLERRGIATWNPGSRATELPLLAAGGTGPRARLITGLFSFADARENHLLAALPPLLHVRGSGGRGVPWLEAILQTLLDESTHELPGLLALAERLADVIFVQSLRMHVRDSTSLPSWLRGLNDPAMSRALAAIHGAPDGAHTIASLAARAGMSRSLFVARFRAVVGRPVFAYVTDWRMNVACGLLRSTKKSIATIAAAVGYGSDVAFTRAFGRWSRVTPAAYRAASSGAHIP